MSPKIGESSEKAAAAQELAVALRDGLKLIQTDSEPSKQNQQQHPDLKSILQSRLSQYYSLRDEDWAPEQLDSQRDAELLTAREALSVLERIQRTLAIEDNAIVPSIGTRDLSQIRTLLSLLFKWGTDPLLNQVKEVWPTKSLAPFPSSSSRIVDFSNLSDEYSLLSEITLRVLGLILPYGVHGKPPSSHITATLLNRHLADILRPALGLGWLPKSLSTEGMPVVDSIRPLIMRLLSILPTSQTISSLGGIISSSPPPPLHVYRICTTLLSRQILRPNGIEGLFGAVFGEEETSGGAIAVEKLEDVSAVLNAVPANTKPRGYFEHVVPRVIALLSENSSPAHRRAAAFTISHMLREEDSPALYPLKRSIILGMLHEPLQHVHEELDGHDLQQLERHLPGTKIHLRPDVVIEVLLALLSNADPSPSFISELLSPILPSLYALLYHLNKVKTSNPKLKESLHGMLVTWGKIATQGEGLEVLWSIINDGQESGWKVDLEGHIRLLSETERMSSSLSLLTPDKVPDTVDLEDPDFDANIFNLFPDPLHFIKLLKDIDRSDVSVDLFVRLLEAYQGEKARSGGDSIRVLLYLQIIMQMQKHLLEGTTSNILKKPQQMLSFIHHVLESANAAPPEPQYADKTKLEEKPRVVSLSPEMEEEPEHEGDSDDDMPDSESKRPDDEMIETAINLLLSVLEADEGLSARTMPILNDIFSLLEPLSKVGSSAIRPLAREARLAMTARLASTSQPRNSRRKTGEEESIHEIYQNALKLLQDPILPVRAHGLLLLRQLVTPSKVDTKEQGIRTLDPALTPAILSIFLQSVQDEDSYIFLNSVQGLAAMVDGLGREVLKGLIHEYAGKLEGLGASVVSQQEVVVRTRVGEALSVVVKRCGDALGIYADLLIPPLFRLFRAREIPTILRTSAISLLADCVSTNSLAVLTYIEDLAGAMIDLLQVESAPAQQQASGVKRRISQHTKTELHNNQGTSEGATTPEDKLQNLSEAMDSAPTSNNTKFPPLRRAALHFLGLLVKEATQHAFESSSSNTLLSPTVVQRAVVTLGYISATDEDSVVRVMAREVQEGLGDLQKAELEL